MLYLSIGLGGPVAAWCEDALVRLGAERGVERLPPANGVVGAVLGLVRSSASSAVASVSHPDSQLLDVLDLTGAPFLLALDDPDKFPPGADPVATVRAISAACIALMRFDRLTGALRIHAGMIAADPQKAVSMIAAHFGFSADSGEIAAIAATMPPPAASPDTSETARRMIQGALGGYGSYFGSGVMGALVWTRELFRRASDPERPLSEPVPMRDTAGGRFLIYGPYIDLPPGDWSVQLQMDVSPDGGGQPVVVDVYCQKELAVARYTSRPGAMLTPPLNFSIPEPGGKHVEVHVLIEREGAPGHLTLRHATISPVRPPAADAN